MSMSCDLFIWSWQEDASTKHNLFKSFLPIHSLVSAIDFMDLSVGSAVASIHLFLWFFVRQLEWIVHNSKHGILQRISPIVLCRFLCNFEPLQQSIYSIRLVSTQIHLYCMRTLNWIKEVRACYWSAGAGAGPEHWFVDIIPRNKLFLITANHHFHRMAVARYPLYGLGTTDRLLESTPSANLFEFVRLTRGIISFPWSTIVLTVCLNAYSTVENGEVYWAGHNLEKDEVTSPWEYAQLGLDTDI